MSAQEVKELINLVKNEDDVGMIVSLAGFTSEAEETIRTARVKLETADLSKFSGIWEEAYSMMSEEGQALIPFTPIKAKKQ